jgi:Putative transposase of IS4/5 family (DUF4096)
VIRVLCPFLVGWSRCCLHVRKGECPPWIVPDDLWQRIEPLLPVKHRRRRSPGRRRLPDRLVLQGILFVLHTGIQWEFLPQELGFGSRDDLLATPGAMEPRRRLATSARTAAGRLRSL